MCNHNFPKSDLDNLTGDATPFLDDVADSGAGAMKDFQSSLRECGLGRGQQNELQA